MSADKESMVHAYEVMLYVYNNTPATARRVRTILTHAYPDLLKKYTRFSGYVSSAALVEASQNGFHRGVFILEHFLRMQNSLTEWVKAGGLEYGYEAFEDKVIELSQVHITTKNENSKLISKKVSYESLGISLVHWNDISVKNRQTFHKVLKNRIINISNFPL